MAYPDDTIMKPRRRHTDATTPTTDDIVEGELAINTINKTIYTRNDSNQIIELSGGNDHTHISGDITDLTETINNLINAAQRPTVITTALTAYELDELDENALIVFTADTAVTISIPLNATVPLPIGMTTHLHQNGAGTLTISPAVGVTANAGVSLSSRAQYAALSIMKIAEDEWAVVGDQL